MGLLKFFKREPVKLRKSLLPVHVAFFLLTTPEDGCLLKGISRLMTASIKLGINYTTFQILQKGSQSDGIARIFDDIVYLCHALKKWPFLPQVKIQVLGHWYDLPSRVVDSLREIQEITRNNSAFTMNWCINYDGQQELIDAASLLARQVKMGKLDPERINAEVVKANLYTSEIPPPELVIKSGPLLSLQGFLLWDTSQSTIFFTSKNLTTMTGVSYLKGIEYYQKVRIKTESENPKVDNAKTQSLS